jgi:hypothetical protein
MSILCWLVSCTALDLRRLHIDCLLSDFFLTGKRKDGVAENDELAQQLQASAASVCVQFIVWR